MPEEEHLPRRINNNIDEEILKRIPKGTYVHAHDQLFHNRIRKKRNNHESNVKYLKALSTAAAWVEKVQEQKRVKEVKEKARK